MLSYITSAISYLNPYTWWTSSQPMAALIPNQPARAANELVYDRLEKKIADWKIDFDKQLVTWLDEDVYRQAILTGNKTPEGYYLIVDDEAEIIKNIKQILNVIAYSRVFLNSMSPFHLEFLNFYPKYTKFQADMALTEMSFTEMSLKTAKSWPLLIYRLTKHRGTAKNIGLQAHTLGTKEIPNLWESYYQLYSAIQHLSLSPGMAVFSSVSGFKNDIFPYIQSIVDCCSLLLGQNPLVDSFNNNSENWITLYQNVTKKMLVTSNINDIYNNTGDIIAAVKNILDDIGHHLPPNGPERTSIEETILAVNETRLALNKFNASFKMLPDMIVFISAIYNLYDTLKKHANQTRISLSYILMDKLELSVYQINQLFKHVIVTLDEFEIDHYLKEGTFADWSFIPPQEAVTPGVCSLHHLIEKFHQLLDEYGYEFNEEDRYPYPQAIQACRAEKLNSLPQTCRYFRPMLEARIAKTDSEAQNRRQIIAIEKNINESSITDTINLLLDMRIQQLREEKMQSFFSFSNIKIEKIILLTALRNTMQTEGIHFNEALDKVALEPRLQKNLYLLWEGKTGNVIRHIQHLSAPHDVIIQNIDLEILKLMKERKKNYLFFQHSKKWTLEKRIAALKKLKRIINQPGHSLAYTLGTLRSCHLEDHNILLQYENNFLNEIEKIEALCKQNNVDFKNGKINLSSRQMVEPISFDNQPLIAKLQVRHDLLCDEIRNSWLPFPSVIKEKKLLLISLLIKELQHNNLQDALEKISSDENHCAYYYLLWQGRTGTLMHELENMVLNAPALLELINLQIIKLKKQREIKPSFFACRKPQVEARIDALKNLHQLIKTNPSASIEDLTHANQDTLRHFEQNIINTFIIFQQNNQENKAVPAAAPIPVA